MLEKALCSAKYRDEESVPTLRAWEEYPVGYPRLAERIAFKPETGIYRRFDALNARRVLYLQSELCTLEQELRLAEKQDNKSRKGHQSQYALDYQCMVEDQDGQESRQMKLLERMNEKLDKYSEFATAQTPMKILRCDVQDQALIQVSTLHKIKAPDRFDLHNMQKFLRSGEMGPTHMDGIDVKTWGKPENPDNHPPDIIGVHPRHVEDKFSRVVSEHAIYLFKYGLGLITKGNKDVGRKVYYDTTVIKITLWFSSMIAAVLPIASILVLIQLNSLKAKLCTIAAFNVCMSFCLTFIANAKRAEVFAVTSAYVEIVYGRGSLLTSLDLLLCWWFSSAQIAVHLIAER